LALLCALVPLPARGQEAADGSAASPVAVVEATIADLHASMLAGTLTARALVEAYRARIDAFDKRGPGLNAIVRLDDRALAVADSLDEALRRTGRLTGPLHGIPLIVKDNYDVAGLATTVGSRALLDALPADDAFQI